MTCGNSAATWVAAKTERLTVGHLVLCDMFRHPVLLAKEVVTLDHASEGRFELGIGWGSVPAELARYGVGYASARVRVERLAETLAVLRALWSGESVSYQGEHFRLTEAAALPVPTRPIPVTSAFATSCGETSRRRSLAACSASTENP